MNIWIFWACVSAVSVSCTKLDISKRIIPSLASKVDYDKDDLQYTVYIAYFNAVIDKLSDGPLVLWRANKGEKLLQFTIYRLHGERIVAYIHVSGRLENKFLYFKYRDSRWVEIPKDEYCILLSDVLSSRQFIINRDVEDDIVHVYEHDLFGIPARIFISDDRYNITSVVEIKSLKANEPTDDEQLIQKYESSLSLNEIGKSMEISSILWRAKRGERCTFIVVHGDPSDQKLVHIFIQLVDNHKVLYFDKQGDNWVEVRKDQFFEKLQELDEQFEQSIKDNCNYKARDCC
ncbi:signal peptide containing protein [Theileria equi strain WA]|uniref:Signal peptide containing protein n=1 Tax=Theileria equi strain WA TaxID=1537102 RepID=L1LDY6_THEEQ|nr:signal peptide containing protein [Theileria equi strain WA]EKX73494.1 signal peptide containing protein [Theileria equi strain WA]|eukprot:XP_004832946.1 signal peptide containing protein [Theileria equi strain WA]